jgi:hypothetical protein
MADRAVGGDGEAGARRREGAEVDGVGGLARGGIGAPGHRHTGVDHGPGGVVHLITQGVRSVRGERGDLGADGQVGDLVDVDAGVGVPLVLRRCSTAGERHVVDAEGERLGPQPADLEGQLGPGVVLGRLEDVLDGRRVGPGGGAHVEVGRVGGAVHLHEHPWVHGHRGAQAHGVPVGRPAGQRDAVESDDGVPRLGRAAGDLGAELAAGNGDGGAGGGPPGARPSVEAAVGHQLGTVGGRRRGHGEGGGDDRQGDPRPSATSTGTAQRWVHGGLLAACSLKRFSNGRHSRRCAIRRPADRAPIAD